jgi:glycyl-tRNA synthetase beta subunit
LVEKRIRAEIVNRITKGLETQCTHVDSHIQRKLVEQKNDKAWNKRCQAMKEQWGPMFNMAVRGNEAVDALAGLGALKKDGRC